MTGHDAHQGHPGYSPRQVLKDCCAGCLDLSGDPAAALDQMDAETFGRAWRRARERARSGLTDLAEAEAPLLDVLAAVQRKLAASPAAVATGLVPAALNPS